MWQEFGNILIWQKTPCIIILFSISSKNHFQFCFFAFVKYFKIETCILMHFKYCKNHKGHIFILFIYHVEFIINSRQFLLNMNICPKMYLSSKWYFGRFIYIWSVVFYFPYERVEFDANENSLHNEIKKLLGRIFIRTDDSFQDITYQTKSISTMLRLSTSGFP